MKTKSIRFLIMIVFLSVALISCSQNVSLENITEITTNVQTSETLTYCSITYLDGIQYEVPSYWQTYTEDGKVYHYCDDENYLMVSSLNTEFSQENDQALTDKCADTLLDNFKAYPNFSIENNSTSDVDDTYCRKLVCTYTDNNNQTITEMSVVFSIDGIIYSFDGVSLNNVSKSKQDFQRIIGSVIISNNT